MSIFGIQGKRLITHLVRLAITITATSSMVGIVYAADAIRWKVPTGFGTKLTALGDQIIHIADDVKTMTDGRIQMKIFEPKALVPAFEITDAVRDNKLSVGYTWLGYDQGKIPAAPLISAVPFGFEPQEYIAWWYEGGGRKLGEDLYKPHNIHPVLCGLTGPETAGWYRKEMVSLKDFKGLKIRYAGLGGKVLQKLGASVTMLPGGELFQALEKGSIDATEYATPPADTILGLYKIAKYNYFPGWHQTFTSFFFIVNLDEWNKMSKADQAIINTACTAGVLRNLARAEALSGPQIEKNKKNGVVVKTFSADMLRKLRAAYLEVVKKLSSSDENFNKIYSAQQKFHESYKQWSQVGYLPRDF